MSKIKVLQAITAPNWHGATEQVFLLVNNMNSKFIQADLLTRKNSKLDKKTKNLKKIYISSSSKINVSQLKYLAKKIENYDIIHVHDFITYQLIYNTLLFTNKKPKIVLTRHVSYDMSIISLVDYDMGTDAIICVNKKIKENISKSLLKSKLITYIPPGINLTKFNSNNVVSNIRKDLSISNNSIVIINVANLSNGKGQHLLIPAFSKFIKYYQNLHIPNDVYLLLVGERTQSSYMHDLVHSFNLDNNVFLLGYRTDIPEILKISDLFVFPSLMEGLPCSLIQAMAMGKVCITTQVDGIKECVQNNINSIVVKENNIDSLYNGFIRALNLSKTKQNDISKQAIKTAKQFDVNKITKQTLNVYKELLKT